jgi:hypothetical protein
MGTLGDGIVPPEGEKPAFRPARSPVELVGEVVRGEPSLPK